MARPLDGLRVLDMSHFIAGPFCGMHLADQGAEVIKIEPLEGEACRSIGPFVQDKSLYFNSYNRNKKAITLNLKTKAGIELFKQLVKKSDVVIENFRPGTLQKYGCSYDDLSKINPGLILATVSGFGEYSSLSKKAAFDMTIQAISGIMYLSTPEGTDPIKIGAPVGDYVSGLYATVAILIALQYRNKTGLGQYIDIAIFDSLFSIQEYHPYRYMHTGQNPVRVGNRRLTSAPSNMYKTKDGYVYLTCGTNSLWHNICTVMGRSDLATMEEYNTTAKRVDAVEEIDKLVGEWICQYTTREAVEQLDNGGIPCGPVLKIGETVNLPIVKERELIIEMDDPDVGTIYSPGSPIKLSRSPVSIDRGAPKLGQNNEEVFCGLLGKSKDQLNDLKQNGVI